MSKPKRIFIKTIKVVGWIIASVLLLLVALALLIQIPAVQTKLTEKAVAFVEEKIGTEVSLGGISIRFPKRIVLKGIYLEDQQGDTLLYAERLSINTDMWALTKNTIQLNDIALENAVAFISRPEDDSAFNFTYILKAFAGDSTAVPDTLEQEGWNFALQAVALENIRVQYHDLLVGNLADVSLGRFALEMNEFDLGNNRYGVDEILLENSRAAFEQTKISRPQESSKEAADSTAALIFSLEQATMKNVNLYYTQAPLGVSMQLEIGDLNLEPEKINIQDQEILLSSFSLSETLLAYRQESADTVIVASGPERPEEDTTETENSGWTIALDNFTLTDNSIKYNDMTKSHRKGSVDFNHLWLTGLNIDASALRYSPEAMTGDLHNVSFTDQSGFSIRSLKGRVDVSTTEASLDDFLLLTENSRLQLNATARFPALKRIGETWPQAKITSDVDASYISLEDVRYLQPSLLDSLPLSFPKDANLHLDAAVRGTVDNLNIEHLVFATLSETSLTTSGTISGLPKADNLRMNLAIDQLVSTRGDLERILPDTLLPDSMQLPEWIKLQAVYRGSLQVADFETTLTSTVGAITLQGNMNLDSASSMRGMNATLNVNDLNIGHILGKPDTVMGSLAMELEVHTNGLSPEEMNGTLTGHIDHFDFRNYRYRDLRLDGSIRNQIVALGASIDDKNLNLALDGGYNFQQDVPRYKLTLDVRNADFQALNFSASPIRGRGTLMVDMATDDFRVLNGNVGIRKVAIFDGDDLYAIDSLLFASIDQKGRSEINIDSDLLTANFEGSINIFSLPGVVREYFNSYYSLHDSLEVEDAGSQHFRFDIELKNTDILTGLLVPQLETFVPGAISGEFDSEARRLDLQMEIDEIQYGPIGVRSFVFSTNSNPEALNYNVIVDRIMYDSTKIDGLEFNGTVANDSIRTDLIVLDSADNHKYLLAGTFYSRENEFELRLAPERILLNYQPWSVPANNYIRFGGGKFIAQNVQLTNRREKIIIESTREPNTPIHIGFRELNLEYLSSMVAVERPLSGLLEGDINLYSDSSSVTFTSDITIDGLLVKGVRWGDLSLQVEQTNRSRFDVDFALKSDRNDVAARGFYQGGESPSMNLVADIQRFDLASLEPIFANQFHNIKGALLGDISVRGTPERPDVDGNLLFKDTEFFSKYLNTTFAIDDESIVFIDEGISFDAFEIADQNQNEARLNGTILTRNYRDFKFNLDLFTDRFRLLNTTAESGNDLFYGLVEIEANAEIRGDMATPVINMAIGLSDNSHVTYIVPQSEAAVLKTEGIVRFVDKTFEGDPFMQKTEQEASDTIKSTFRGIDLTARIDLSDQERLTIIIDPLTQDQLSIRGNSTLTLNIDPTGDIHLTGRYEISEGTYNLSFYKFVKREFEIESGSTITWTGDPLNAQMDIRAIYMVETSPIALFSHYANESELNPYKERLPFMVYLNITGELLQPEIGFELEMPMDERNALGGRVYARIQDINTRESDLNKQVFALLILKRFIAENPFENDAGGGFESTARRSVSKILSEQLNRLSENIKGVELSFDIKSYEDYSTGEGEGRTELELGFSKSLLNDRLVVKLSGNIDIEGSDANREATDYIGDLALEYKLTPDGRFRITGFRNSNYDMIDGELIETGVGVIYVKDYNSLSELFKANAETKN